MPHAQNVISKFLKKGYSLVPQDSSCFQDITLQERELMFILSTSKPITVEKVEGRKGSVIGNIHGVRDR
jgi:hypothetical protein